MMSAKAPARISAEEKQETEAFLQWLSDRHFIFMGYREYRFTEKSGKRFAEIDTKTGLGLMRDEHYILVEDSRHVENSPAMQDHLLGSDLILIAKGDRQSTVHRTAFLDRIGVKTFDDKGNVVGERIFAGLFTSRAYAEPPTNIPFVRGKVEQVIGRAEFKPDGHNGKALVHILETYPRDELFQIATDQLFNNAIGILNLQDRKKTAVFLREDTFNRFTTALIFFPRDRFNTRVRIQIEAILEKALGGRCTARSLRMDEGPLTQLYIVISRQEGPLQKGDIKDIVAQLTELSRGWLDRVREALIADQSEEMSAQLYRRYENAFPASYQETTRAVDVVDDILKLEEANRHKNIMASLRQTENGIYFKVYHPVSPVPLSDVLPMLENFGLKVISTVPHQVQVQGGLDQPNDIIWLHDFLVEIPAGLENDWQQRASEVEAAFVTAWNGALGKDLFNALILLAGLTGREAFLMRALARFLRQTRFPHSQHYVAEVLSRNPIAASLIVQLFHARHDPDLQNADIADKIAELTKALEKAVSKVSSLDEDRILRHVINLVQSALRTNYYQFGNDVQPKPYVSIKFDSMALLSLPLPRPMLETFIYSTRVEAIHLRTSKVARGGIRWSDRREDYRDEVLGLMKAQNVKNSIIVPSGAKGGFYVKQVTPQMTREEVQAEGIECYRIFVRAILDITDNLVDGKMVPPVRVVCHDDPDHYLVVAADKGTATFSDIANAISQQYGHWLDDAFASGGSAGYDHKGMGITARGAWEGVKRHFREIGKDIQKEDFTVVGVGDMAGDVFGNGALLSEHIRLLGVFNHMHIFCDPNPDSAQSFQERKRMFDNRLPWSDYDPKVMSKGAMVYERKAKTILLTPEIQDCFGFESLETTPNELIRAILKSQVELLWLGGIGTYVKAMSETDGDVLDKANDALRINGGELRCAVVGEGANLGLSQLGRIEYAKNGGRINTDFIDNSAGVDTSDHEVNLKILFSDLMRAKRLTRADRDKLLAQMTDDVAALVLKDNYQQTQSLTASEYLAPKLVDHHAHFIQSLEQIGQLNRKIEYLPSHASLLELKQIDQGLTRPELAILLSYAKINLKRLLLASEFFHEDNQDVLNEELLDYFPSRLRKTYSDAILNHSLRRELIATTLVTSIVNRLGISFSQLVMDRTGCDVAELIRAFVAAKAIFEMEKTWTDIEALDSIVPASVQADMLVNMVFFNNRVIPWLLLHVKSPMAITQTVERFQKDIKSIARTLPDVVSEPRRTAMQTTQSILVAQGVPETLAGRIAILPHLAAGFYISAIAADTGWHVKVVSRVYFQIADRFRFDWLQEKALLERKEDYWQRQTHIGLQEDFSEHHAELTRRILTEAAEKKYKEKDIFESWSVDHADFLNRLDTLLIEFQSPTPLDLSMLSVINRRLKGYLGS